eukprot:CAMPEP_0176349250 /NCGR_PEP_ID=MMETSP0126-20121128/8511_1 /TAXON_ID=141414 ORGANISM="Strombidinopsis acuminatum, Strain SPMC142" /NCGR_SAMPLE_ID=MMETSP0126 /ASSEMBLY_ACC=CAM_ASM_000229 /LENGTH=93 /DNA_ID=CAMNT_0017698521 /DNA_START=191 /DNA_END=472 /DNA_ORIENTATION=+
MSDFTLDYGTFININTADWTLCNLSLVLVVIKPLLKTILVNNMLFVAGKLTDSARRLKIKSANRAHLMLHGSGQGTFDSSSKTGSKFVYSTAV